jgi:hypothetical protein
MEAQWIADRAALRCLARQHPTWTPTELARLSGAFTQLGQKVARVACERPLLMI